MSAQERETCLLLVANLERTWTDVNVTLEIRKHILRAAFVEVVASVEGSRVRLLLHWRGGDYAETSIRGDRTGRCGRERTSGCTGRRAAGIRDSGSGRPARSAGRHPPATPPPPAPGARRCRGRRRSPAAGRRPGHGRSASGADVGAVRCRAGRAGMTQESSCSSRRRPAATRQSPFGAVRPTCSRMDFDSSLRPSFGHIPAVCRMSSIWRLVRRRPKKVVGLSAATRRSMTQLPGGAVQCGC